MRKSIAIFLSSRISRKGKSRVWNVSNTAKKEITYSMNILHRNVEHDHTAAGLFLELKADSFCCDYHACCHLDKFGGRLLHAGAVIYPWWSVVGVARWLLIEEEHCSHIWTWSSSWTLRIPKEWSHHLQRFFNLLSAWLRNINLCGSHEPPRDALSPSGIPSAEKNSVWHPFSH